jgi:hypothetical protein
VTRESPGFFNMLKEVLGATASSFRGFYEADIAFGSQSGRGAPHADADDPVDKGP